MTFASQIKNGKTEVERLKTKKAIKKFYDKRYKNHNYNGDVPSKDPLPFYFEFVERIKPLNKKMQVLEIGAGAGNVINFICNHVKEVHGVDISSVAINMAEKYLKKNKKQNYKLYVRDNIEFFKDKKFDLIYEMTVFQHMLRDHTIEYINQCYRKLKDDGLVMFQFIYNSMQQKEMEVKDQENRSSWTKDEITDTLIKEGFEIVSFNVHDLSFMLKGNQILESYYVIAKKQEEI